MQVCLDLVSSWHLLLTCVTATPEELSERMMSRMLLGGLERKPDMMGPYPSGNVSSSSGGFYLAAKYLRLALPFLEINTCSVESEIFFFFF